MSELKDIVPPLELCKQIPAGEFEDSVLVWLYWAKDESSFGNVVPRILKDQFSSILPGLGAVLKAEVPAPTLAEIFKVLPETIDTPEDEFCVLSLMPSRDDDEEDMFWIGYNNTNGKDANPATAALRLWLAMREEEEQP